MRAEPVDRADRAVQARWLSFVRDCDDLLGVFTVEGRLAAANPAWANVTGRSVESLTGRPVRELLHPDDVAEFDLAFARSVDTGTASIETRLRSGDGSYRWSWWRLRTGPERQQVSAVVRDVNGRHDDESTTARLAALVASSGDAIITKSLDGTVQTWNDGAERMYGYTAEEMIGKPITVLAPPGRVDEVADLLARVASGEPAIHCETIRVRKDGTHLEVSLTVSPIRTARGAITGASAISRDVTAHRRAEREQIKLLIESASDPFVLIDHTGVIVEWNQRATEVFGWPRDEAIGRRLADVVIPERDRAEHLRTLHALTAGDGPTPAGTDHARSYLRRDGSEITMEATLWRANTVDGYVVGGFMRDVTARRLVEQSITEARDQAIEATRLKSQFLASMSHEIRTPMNAVIGLTGLLLTTTLSTAQRRYANGINIAGETLLSVINDILDFSKIEAGKITLDEVDFAPADIIEDVVALVAGAARDKELELVGSYPAILPSTRRGDPTRLRQVLLNLAANAVKFTEHGEVIVRALPDEGYQGPVPTGAQQILFEVTDTGVGIDTADQQRLFQPFTQADASTTRRYGGTGLGLAISYELVRLMGGTMGVRSQRGHGSTFWCSIPLAAPSTADRSTTLQTLDGLRILVVDDNETNRLILDQQLHSWGVQATTVADATQALQHLHDAAIDHRPYQLSLLDLRMPGMSGLELATLINASTDIPAHPIALLSSEIDVDQAEATAAGIRATLFKPIRNAELFDTLVDLAAGTPTEPATPRQPTAPTGQPRTGDILLAEDNELNQIVGTGILTGLGYHVEVAKDGQQAVTMATHHHYDAVLMDCHMPIMDGYTATAEIRRIEGANRHTPIIALTAAALPEDRAHCAEAGMDDYIAKPVTPNNIDQHLLRWIQQTTATNPDLPTFNPRTTAQVRPAISERLDLFRNSDGTANVPLQTRILDVFIESLPNHVRELTGALNHHDATQLLNIAHTTKGLSQTIGALHLADLCADLETHARNSRYDTAATTIADIGAATRIALTAAGELLTTRHGTAP